MEYLSNIAVILEDRRWMKAAKAWRLFLKLPTDQPLIPSLLSGMIDQQFKVTLDNITIDPAQIVDVPMKNKSFQLVIETCYEKQNGIAPFITDMAREGRECLLSILPQSDEPQSTAPVSTEPRIDKEALKGLHILFQNPKIQEYVIGVYNRTCDVGQELENLTTENCKDAFKQLAHVASCKDLAPEYMTNWRKGLNQWLNRKP